MKTTLDIPDPLFRKAKAEAAERGVSFREVVAEALTEKLLGRDSTKRPWMRSFGGLRKLRKESARIGALVEQEFGQLET